MTPMELAAALKHVMSSLDDIAHEMNTSATACDCCGMTKRDNFDDWQARQALEGAHGRVAKLYEKLLNNDWHGRELVATTPASEMRGT